MFTRTMRNWYPTMIDSTCDWALFNFEDEEHCARCRESIEPERMLFPEHGHPMSWDGFCGACAHELSGDDDG